MAGNLTKFFFEIGQLKRVRRSGWWCAGVSMPESVADHCFRASLIGYFLAKKKGMDAEKVAMMLLMHDLPETRINDLHKVGQRYVDFEKAERRALEGQLSSLGKAGSEYKALMREFLEGRTGEAIIARDADWLECAIQAREYTEIGVKDAENWVVNIGKKLRTKEAKGIYKEVKKAKMSDWWEKLKKL